MALAALAHGRCQLAFAALAHELAIVDDEQAVAGLADLGQEVAGNEHGVLAAQAAQEVAHLHDLRRIQAGRRLVENEQRGFVHDGLGQAHALAIPVRQLADDLAVHVAQGGFLLGLGDARRGFAGGHLAQARRKGQVGTHGHLGIERGKVGQKADLLADLVGVLGHLEAVHAHGSRGWQQQTAQDPQGRGLSGPVEPQESHDFALGDGEGEIADGCPLAEILGELVHFDHDRAVEVHSFAPPSKGRKCG
jgi:hypothetical protein